MGKSLDRHPAQNSVKALSNRPAAEYPLRLRDATLQRHLGLFLTGVCVLGCIFVALFSWLSAMREWNQRQRLEQAGVTTQGEVISRTDIGHGMDRLTYRFSVTSSAGVRQSLVGTTTVGQPRQPVNIPYQINIVYDPADPRVSRMSDDNRPPAGVFSRMFPFCWLGWLPLLGGFLTAMRARNREELAQQLDQSGQMASAVVIERSRAYGRPGGPCVTYEFDAQLPDGQYRRVVKAEIVDLVTRFQRLQVGVSVQVRYLPNDPNVCRIEWI